VLREQCEQSTTPIISGDFTFSRPPEEQDSDGDGVPALLNSPAGLDPAGGQDDDGDGLLDLDEILGGTRPDLADSDGDGATDREERAAGTDPNNASSVPSESQIMSGTQSASERHAVFDLFLSPRPYDGVIAAYTVAATNVLCRITLSMARCWQPPSPAKPTILCADAESRFP
jgi:hypothetical protein